MIIFDTLSQLETYLSSVKLMNHVISIMDRSLPYEAEDGFYSCKEEESVTYTVSSALTSRNGFPFTVEKGSLCVIIALEGEEIVSSLDSSMAFVLSEGRFLLLSEGEYKRGVMTTLPGNFRDVRFSFPDK